MRICQTCGNTIPEDEVVCPYCSTNSKKSRAPVKIIIFAVVIAVVIIVAVVIKAVFHPLFRALVCSQ